MDFQHPESRLFLSTTCNVGHITSSVHVKIYDKNHLVFSQPGAPIQQVIQGYSSRSGRRIIHILQLTYPQYTTLQHILHQVWPIVLCFALHTCRQNRELVSIDEVLRLFIDKLGTNRLFSNYPQTKIASLWSPTRDGKLETCSAIFCSVNLI